MNKSKILGLGVTFAVSVLCSGFAFAEKIVITAQPQHIVVAKDVDAQPDDKGFVLSREVVLPAFVAGAYYRPYSDGAPRGNRVEAVAFSSLADLQGYQPSATRKGHASIQQGQFILLKINDAKYLALLPMVSREIYSQFFMENGMLLLKAGNFGTGGFAGGASQGQTLS